MVIQFKKVKLKPFIVEFAGPPKSGKTTLIERIKYQLPHTLSIVKEVSIESPVPKKKVLKYMEWSANQLINKLLFIEEMIGKQVVLVDCGIISQLSLLNAFDHEGKIKGNEREYYDLLRKHLWMNLQREHLVFYVDINIDDELKRIKNYKFPQGFIINKSFLKALNESYKQIILEVERTQKNKIKLIRLNGLIDPERNSHKVSKEIIQEYKKHLKKH
jgi:deoxyadenosine/deoxycytidine kinase